MYSFLYIYPQKSTPFKVPVLYVIHFSPRLNFQGFLRFYAILHFFWIYFLLVFFPVVFMDASAAHIHHRQRRGFVTGSIDTRGRREYFFEGLLIKGVVGASLAGAGGQHGAFVLPHRCLRVGGEGRTRDRNKVKLEGFSGTGVAFLPLLLTATLTVIGSQIIMKKVKRQKRKSLLKKKKKEYDIRCDID